MNLHEKIAELDETILELANTVALLLERIKQLEHILGLDK
jgi:hypothetical protein